MAKERVKSVYALPFLSAAFAASLKLFGSTNVTGAEADIRAGICAFCFSCTLLILMKEQRDG